MFPGCSAFSSTVRFHLQNFFFQFIQQVFQIRLFFYRFSVKRVDIPGLPIFSGGRKVFQHIPPVRPDFSLTDFKEGRVFEWLTGLKSGYQQAMEEQALADLAKELGFKGFAGPPGGGPPRWQTAPPGQVYPM